MGIPVSDEIVLDRFGLHRLLYNTLKKVSIGEAAVERAFSRHKLIHSRLRANLKDPSIDKLFIRYNFDFIIGVANREVEEIEVLQTISPLEEAE